MGERLRRTVVFSLLLSFYISSLTPGSPALAEQPSPPDAKPLPQPLSGEAIFRGLFFGTGPIAKQFPEIWEDLRVTQSQSQTRTGAAQQVESDLLNLISSEKPGFFDEFAAAMQSGDQVNVSTAIDEGGTILLQALKKRIGTYDEDYQDPNGMGIIFYVFVYAAVAVFALVAAVLNVVLFREKIWTKGMAQSVPGGDFSALKHDMYVELVAARLRLAL